MPKLYRKPSPTDPISQGDIFKDIPNPVTPFDHHLVESNGAYRIESRSGDVRADMNFLSAVELVSAIVLTQSCDVPRAENILLAPLSSLNFDSGKPERHWAEIQKFATSLHQPTRFYLPDDPAIGLNRHLAEMSELFTLPRLELAGFALSGKRVASLADEGVSYLAFRFAMMIWRVARDDYAWPSKADLSLKKSYLERELSKWKNKIQQLEKLTNEQLTQIEELQSALDQLRIELDRTNDAIARFDGAPSDS